MNVMEFSRIPWLKKSSFNGYVTCEGLDNLREAQRKGKGVILLTAHLGNWELMAAYLGLTGYLLDIVVRDLDNQRTDDFVRWARTRSGNRVVPKERSMRGLLKSLKKGGIVGILLDQNVTWSEGVFVNFFDRPACTNKGAALLAAASAAAVIPAFIVRKGRRHRIIIGPEIPTVNTGRKSADGVENTFRFTKVIEEMVRRYPDQWFWVHQRWKSRPDNDPRRGTELAAPVRKGPAPGKSVRR